MTLGVVRRGTDPRTLIAAAFVAGPALVSVPAQAPPPGKALFVMQPAHPQRRVITLLPHTDPIPPQPRAPFAISLQPGFDTSGKAYLRHFVPPPLATQIPVRGLISLQPEIPQPGRAMLVSGLRIDNIAMPYQSRPLMVRAEMTAELQRHSVLRAGVPAADVTPPAPPQGTKPLVVAAELRWLEGRGTLRSGVMPAPYYPPPVSGAIRVFAERVHNRTVIRVGSRGAEGVLPPQTPPPFPTLVVRAEYRESMEGFAGIAVGLLTTPAPKIHSIRVATEPHRPSHVFVRGVMLPTGVNNITESVSVGGAQRWVGQEVAEGSGEFVDIGTVKPWVGQSLLDGGDENISAGALQPWLGAEVDAAQGELVATGTIPPWTGGEYSIDASDIVVTGTLAPWGAQAVTDTFIPLVTESPAAGTLAAWGGAIIYENLNETIATRSVKRWIGSDFDYTGKPPSSTARKSPFIGLKIRI